MNTQQTQKASLPGWVDNLLLLVILLVSGGALIYDVHAGLFSVSLTNDQQWSWHLVRAAGLTAYALVGISTVWGLFLASRLIKDWAPGPMSLLLHASTSWMAVVMGFVHLGLLLWDHYYKYSLADLVIPFIGPYRPFAVGLGTVAAWLILAITISFSLRKLIGQRNWRLLHYTSYVTFGLVTLHGLMAGTDASDLGMQLLVAIFTLSIAIILVLRIARSVPKRTARTGLTRARLND